MATNQYFNKFSNSAEQRLVQDLVDEAIKINGVDMVYIPRSVMNEDEIFGEDRLPKFESGRQLEMYVESYDGYEGGGEQFTSIGLQIDDRMTVVVSRRRFLEVFADKNYSYPREGDLIYFPLNKDVFEINFVDREYNFFNFGFLCIVSRLIPCDNNVLHLKYGSSKPPKSLIQKFPCRKR